MTRNTVQKLQAIKSILVGAGHNNPEMIKDNLVAVIEALIDDEWEDRWIEDRESSDDKN